MVMIGIDYHPSDQYIAFVDIETGECGEWRLDPRPHLHQSVPVPKQLPQITILRTGHPDLGKVIFQQQLQQKLRIVAVGLVGSMDPSGAGQQF
jgi:hypothetical protein